MLLDPGGPLVGNGAAERDVDRRREIGASDDVQGSAWGKGARGSCGRGRNGLAPVAVVMGELDLPGGLVVLAAGAVEIGLGLAWCGNCGGHAAQLRPW